MNIQPLKRADVGGIARHNFRLGDKVPEHVDPERTPLNKVLYGDSSVPGALGPLPDVQPDTGRKIRDDARHVASFVFTLPNELDGNAAGESAWVQETQKWLKHECPGELAYAVVHHDEGRVHIQAAVRPVDSLGHLDYKRYFGTPQKLAELHKSYDKCVEYLGVHPNSPALKNIRAAQYERGINGWRVGLATRQLAEKAQRLEARERAVDAPPVPFRAPKKSIFERQKKYQARVREAVTEGINLRVKRARSQEQREAQRLAEKALQRERDRAAAAEAEAARVREQCQLYLRIVHQLNDTLRKEFDRVLTQVANAFIGKVNKAIEAKAERNRELAAAAQAEAARVRELARERDRELAREQQRSRSRDDREPGE